MPITIYPTDDERLIRPQAQDDELAQLRADNIAAHDLIETQREMIAGLQYEVECLTVILDSLTHS